MEVNASLVNFAAGQLSKKFLGRVDLPNFYNSGALICRNYIPQVQGPAEFRTGSQYILHTRGNALTSLYPFVFNDDQSYALAFSDKKLRFFSDGGVIMGSAGATQFDFLSHFDGVDGATSYTAESGQALSFKGDAQLDTAQKVFGTASLLLDGTGDYVNISDTSLLAFGTDDFTVDLRMRFANTPSNDAILGSTGSGFLIDVRDTTTVNVYPNWGTVLRFTTSVMAATTWYHLAVVRKGNNLSVFLDGVKQGASQDVSGWNITAAGTPQIGTYAGNLPFDGWLDEVAIRKGTAVWDANFVIPTAAYTYSGSRVITAISAADPGVITSATHGYTGGEEIYISGVLGMTELNDKYFLVVYIDGDTFSLTDVDGTAIDTTAYTAYVSGGSADAIYEIDTPYAEDDLAGLQFAQKADLMYIVHPNYEPRKLIRSGDADWALSVYTRTADPFTKTITGITAADPGVVTATAHGFSDGDTIEIWGVVGMTEVNGNQYTVANKAANTFELTDPTTGVDVDTSGYTAYSSAGKTFKAENMPGAAAFYGGRLFFGGTDDEPESFWGSKAPTNAGVTQYDDFTVGAAAGDAVTFPISSQNNRADRIQWFSGTGSFLGIGTFGGVYKANGGSDSDPISGIAINVQVVDYNGCRNLDALRLSNSIFYVQRGGIVLNAFAFSLLADSYSSKSLNIFSDEITDSGIVQVTAQQGTSDIIWCVLDNGKLIGMTVKLGEEINAWHSHEMGGTDVNVLSVCGEPQPDNKDSLWLVVERTINGVTRRYMEYMAADVTMPEPEDYYTADQTVDDTMYESLLFEKAKELIRVDSALSLSGAQDTTLTPAAVTGTGIAFTAGDGIFAATDVGRYLIKKYITGEETGRALITAYVSATEVTCTIEDDFDSVTAVPAGEWYLTFTEVSGLGHLEGETVTAQIDGADDEEDYTVASGAITLASAATYVHVGLKYTGRLTTMPLNIGALVGTAQGHITTVNRLCLLFRHARATKYGTDLYRLDQVLDRDISPVDNRPSRLKTQVDFLNIPDGYDRRKFIHIIQDTANPSTIQAIVPYVDTTNE